MENPRPEKVGVVTEVRERLDAAGAAILTEYRGLSVGELAELRRVLATVGGDYKVYKNTLVKLAIAGGRHEPLEPLLQGPTAIAFVSGEVSAVAKALRDFSRTYPSLIVKGGLHGEGFLSPQDLSTLADLPPRDVLLARVAGALAAPLQQLAGLMQALPRNLAYGLSALLDQQGGAPVTEAESVAEPESAPEPEAPAEPVAAEAPAPAEPVAAAEAEPVAAAEAEPVAAAETPAPAEPVAAEPEAQAPAEPVAAAEAEPPTAEEVPDDQG